MPFTKTLMTTLPFGLRVCCSMPFTKTLMTTLPFGLKICPCSGSAVDDSRFLDDETIFDQFADIISGVSIADFICFIGIKPNLTLSTFQYTCSQTFLKP